jgi:hypothetical protein
MSLNSSIEKRLEMLEQSEQEYKTQKEMLNDALANDGELGTLEEKMKDAKRRHAAQKEALLNEPENAKIQEQMKDLAQEIKDTKKLLGDELLTYFMQNNSLEYTDGKGKKRRISVSAKFGRDKEEE